MTEVNVSTDSQGPSIPIRIYSRWADELSLPELKARQTELLDAVIRVVAAYGGKEIQIDDIKDNPATREKMVMLRAEGAVDFSALDADLKRELKSRE